nr:MAG TPA: hypothetical protein [Caudoviricetes sp.]
MKISLIFQCVCVLCHKFESCIVHHLTRNPVVIETTGFSLYFNGLRFFDAIGITIHLSHF